MICDVLFLGTCAFKYPVWRRVRVLEKLAVLSLLVLFAWLDRLIYVESQGWDGVNSEKYRNGPDVPSQWGNKHRKSLKVEEHDNTSWQLGDQLFIHHLGSIGCVQRQGFHIADIHQKESKGCVHSLCCCAVSHKKDLLVTFSRCGGVAQMW